MLALLSYPTRGQFLVTLRGQFSMARDTNAKRGHSGENEQHAPQAWQSEAVTSTACVGKTVI
jgi:hypothetical protein